VTHIVIYFSKDVATYMNLIQHEVNSRGIGLPEDDLGGGDNAEVTLKTRFEKTMTQTMNTDEYRADYARLEGEVLRITGKPVPDSKRKYADLKEHVAKLLENEFAAKGLNKLPTADLEKAVDPMNTYSLEELKEVAKNEGVKGWALYQDAAKLKAKIIEARAAQIPVMGE